MLDIENERRSMEGDGLLNSPSGRAEEHGLAQAPTHVGMSRWPHGHGRRDRSWEIEHGTRYSLASDSN
jgi:hypothetical protein